ncbi:MAG: FHA domain-containing protein, partial [Wujia sp.]
PQMPKPPVQPMPQAPQMPKPPVQPMPQAPQMTESPVQSKPQEPQSDKPVQESDKDGATMLANNEPPVVPAMGRPVPASQKPVNPEIPQGSLVAQMGVKPIPHMVRKKTGEIINITKPEFSIGKSQTKADYAIEDNSAISRVHCIIVQRDGVNYIKDNGSTNHTYVNGVELEPGKEVLLKNKTIVHLGDEEFTFLLRKGD